MTFKPQSGPKDEVGDLWGSRLPAATDLDTAIAKLRSRGWLVMEFGFGQEDEVRGLVAARPALRFDRFRSDLQGLARTAIIQVLPRE